jgi:hypothetical protein
MGFVSLLREMEKSIEFIRGAAMKFGAGKVIFFGSCKEKRCKYLPAYVVVRQPFF